MSLEEAVTIARIALYENPKIDQKNAYDVLAKFHGRMPEMQRFAETYFKEKEVK
jgi:hypothetical protein